MNNFMKVLVKVANSCDQKGLHQEASELDEIITKLADEGLIHQGESFKSTLKQNKAEDIVKPTAQTIRPSGFIGMRVKAAVYEYDVPGGRKELVAYWPDSKNNWPTRTQTPEGPTHYYPAAIETGRPAPAKQGSPQDFQGQIPKGFEDINYFVMPN